VLQNIGIHQPTKLKGKRDVFCTEVIPGELFLPKNYSQSYFEMEINIHHWNNSGISKYVFGGKPANTLMKEGREEYGFRMNNDYGVIALALCPAEPLFDGYRVIQILFGFHGDFIGENEESDSTTSICLEYVIGSYSMKRINYSSGSDMSTDSDGESIEQKDKDSLLFTDNNNNNEEGRQEIDEQREFVKLSYQLNDKLVGEDSNLEALRLWISPDVHNDVWLNCNKWPGFTVVRLLEYLKKYKPQCLHIFYSIIKEKMQFPEIAGMIEKSPCFNLFNKS